MGRGSGLLPASILVAAMMGTAALADGRTQRISIDTGGDDPNGASLTPSISADGRYVAFQSDASDLVVGDNNHSADVFVRDLPAGITVRASVDTGGSDPDGYSFDPFISADGRYVAFWSNATDLVTGDGNSHPDVFVRDLLVRTTVRASVDSGGGDPDGASYSPSIGPDGRYVAFHSYASDLVVEDGNATADVFVRDLVTGTTVRVSVDTGGGDPDGASAGPSISADGRFVAFDSWAPDLVAGDRNHLPDIYVRDLVAGTTARASLSRQGRDPNGESWYPSISADGRYVAYYSYASNLVARDGNGAADIFVRDLLAGSTIRASVDMGGKDPNDDSKGPSLSSEGRFVAFSSGASDLVGHDWNDFSDVFVRDLVSGTTVRASVDTEGGDPDGDSGSSSFSADGRYLVFGSFATDLVAGDGNGLLDVFGRRVGRWPAG